MVETSRVTVPGAEELLGKYFPVLDHGFVALVDYMGADDSIVQAARVSYGAGTKKKTEDRGLNRYLMNHRHTTPTEMVELKFHMKLPIFVARQLIRHRTASVNEYSGRYSLMPMQFYTPKDAQMAKQSKKNKQGRAGLLTGRECVIMQDRWDVMREEAKAAYLLGLDYDLARELARIDLPLSMYTEWYWKMDLHNLFHFLGLRCDSHAQWEIRQFADVIAGMVKMVAPNSYESWIDYRFCAKNFSRLDLIALEETLRTGQMGEARLKEIGLSKREIEDYRLKTSGAPEVPDHTLDLSLAKDGAYFAKQAELATPVLGE
jgi:thymidylate synthase (FAD)